MRVSRSSLDIIVLFRETHAPVAEAGEFISCFWYGAVDHGDPFWDGGLTVAGVLMGFVGGVIGIRDTWRSH